MKKIKVGIIGHTGRLGRILMELLGRHPCAEIVYTESRRDGEKGNLSEAEIAFLAMPHGESKNYLGRLREKRIIDLSLDHRSYKDWTYGLSEIFPREIEKAKWVANPGCYATAVLLALYPLKNKIKSAAVAATSGISGAGLEASKEDNFLIYKEGKQHPQAEEIEKNLGISDTLFVPQRIDTSDRGIISTIFVQPDGAKKLSQLYEGFYEKCPFVRVRETIETRNVIGTNYCDIKVLEFEEKAIIISALDNIMKGGAGQAIQNFNLMCGFQETLGLM